MKKTVIITGTSSGIGNTTAKHFATKGWNVVATMRNPDDAKDLTDFRDVLVTRLDVQVRTSIDRAIELGIAHFGRIDAVVNNAGYGLFGLFESTPREQILEQFGVNVFGVMDVTRAILPHFRKNKSGLVINVSSGAGVSQHR
ncbi:MAG: SDR family NAD(P)-dependent oxidoreductase [Limisphaerales bacterium]